MSKCLPKSSASVLYSVHHQLVCSSKHLLTTTLSVVIQWVINPLSLGLTGNLDWWSWTMYSFLQAVQQQICISRQLTPASQGIVNCIFCVEIFIDLARSQGTKNKILLPSPTLDVQSASVCATNSKFPGESTINIELHSLFRTQLMHLHKCHLTILN